jgi:hypothetical protein
VHGRPEASRSVLIVARPYNGQSVNSCTHSPAVPSLLVPVGGPLPTRRSYSYSTAQYLPQKRGGKDLRNASRRHGDIPRPGFDLLVYRTGSLLSVPPITLMVSWLAESPALRGGTSRSPSHLLRAPEDNPPGLRWDANQASDSNHGDVACALEVCPRVDDPLVGALCGRTRASSLHPTRRGGLVAC